MNDILLWFFRVLAAAVWVYANWYLIQNRPAVAKLCRGYGAYERWKMREWVTDGTDAFDLGERDYIRQLRRAGKDAK